MTVKTHLAVLQMLDCLTEEARNRGCEKGGVETQQRTDTLRGEGPQKTPIDFHPRLLPQRGKREQGGRAKSQKRLSENGGQSRALGPGLDLPKQQKNWSRPKPPQAIMHLNSFAPFEGTASLSQRWRLGRPH